MSDVQRTHFADDETLAYIAKLEAENAALRSLADVCTMSITNQPCSNCNCGAERTSPCGGIR